MTLYGSIAYNITALGLGARRALAIFYAYYKR